MCVCMYVCIKEIVGLIGEPSEVIENGGRRGQENDEEKRRVKRGKEA